MSRVILLLAILILIALVYRRFQTHKRQTRLENKRALAQNIVRCDYCGLHVPEYESFHSNDRNYCSQEHQAFDQAHR